MAVKPVYTYHAEKNLPCGALYGIFNTYITNKTVVLFFHHTETYYAKPNLGEWAIAAHGMYESHEVSLVLM
jgi:hypothetical protein